MKLLRVGPLGGEKVYALDNQGGIRDLSSYLDDLNPDTINFKNLDHLKKINLNEMKIISPTRIGSPVSRPGDFLLLASIIEPHADKTKSEIKKEPIVFNKKVLAVFRPNDNVLKPKNSQKLDHEIEVAIAIGKKGKNIKKSSAKWTSSLVSAFVMIIQNVTGKKKEMVNGLKENQLRVILVLY